MPFVPTPAEVALVNQIFLRGDTQKLNALTGDKAIGIFKAASLPEAILGDIWAIGDPENNGFLTRAGCAKVVRLIGWAQHGEVNIGDHLLERGRRASHISLLETPAYVPACSRTARGA
jgi:epidermal growth factor receptor substrate 15